MARLAVFLLRTLAVMCRILLWTLHCTQATFTTAFDRKKLPHDWNSGKSLFNQKTSTPHPHYRGMVIHSCVFDFEWLCKKSTLHKANSNEEGWPWALVDVQSLVKAPICHHFSARAVDKQTGRPDSCFQELEKHIIFPFHPDSKQNKTKTFLLKL